MTTEANTPNEFDRSKYVTVGEIGNALDVIVTMAKLEALGYAPVATFGKARYFRRDQVPAIAASLAGSITKRAEGWQ